MLYVEEGKRLKSVPYHCGECKSVDCYAGDGRGRIIDFKKPTCNGRGYISNFGQEHYR